MPNRRAWRTRRDPKPELLERLPLGWYIEALGEDENDDLRQFLEEGSRFGHVTRKPRTNPSHRGTGGKQRPVESTRAWAIYCEQVGPEGLADLARHKAAAPERAAKRAREKAAAAAYWEAEAEKRAERAEEIPALVAEWHRDGRALQDNPHAAAVRRIVPKPPDPPEECPRCAELDSGRLGPPDRLDRLASTVRSRREAMRAFEISQELRDLALEVTRSDEGED